MVLAVDVLGGYTLSDDVIQTNLYFRNGPHGQLEKHIHKKINLITLYS